MAVCYLLAFRLPCAGCPPRLLRPPRPVRPTHTPREVVAVSKLLWLKLKSQRYLLVLLLVVVALQLVMAQASSYVLADRQPPLSIAIQQLSDSPLSNQLVDNLSNIPGFQAIPVDNSLSPSAVFRQVNVQALLVIPADFGSSDNQNKRPPVTLYPAPGVTNNDFAREQVANTIMQLWAQQDLQQGLEAMGSNATLANGVTTSDLLDVVYDGPLIQSSGGTQASGFSMAPVYGVSALLVLIAFLHAALTVPTRQDKRILMRGRAAYLRQLAASLLVVWLVWLVVVALYFATTTVLIGSPPNLLTALGFVAIMFYASLLGALLAQVMGRHATSWVFLPLFLLSMTLGGGLWANITLSPLLSPLVPVAAVTVPGNPTLQGTVVLFVAGAILLLLLLLVVLLLLQRSSVQRGASHHPHPKESLTLSL